MAQIIFYNEPYTVKIGDTANGAGAPDFLADATQLEGATPTPDPEKDKDSAGCDLSLLFAPFSAPNENNGGFPETISEEQYDVIKENIPGAARMHNHYIRKYKLAQGYIISNNNLEEEANNRVPGSFLDIKPGEHDENSFRGICLDAPVYVAGFGMQSSGAIFGAEQVGPLDMVWDDRVKIWKARQEFPVPGRIRSSTGNKTYTVEILGVIWTDGNNPRDFQYAETGVTSIPGDGRYELENVFNLQEDSEDASTQLTAGDYVTIFYDSRGDAYSCIKGSAEGGGGGSITITLNGESQPGNELIIPIGETIRKITLSGSNLDFETGCLTI